MGGEGEEDCEGKRGRALMEGGDGTSHANSVFFESFLRVGVVST